jgi:hypothetical protein
MLRMIVGLVALLGLAACGAKPSWAPQDQVDAVRFVAAGPTYITLYTTVNTATGSGSHSAILVNASERVVFDPAGPWYHPNLPERNDVHFGMNDQALAFYTDYYTRETYELTEQRIEVSPAVAELVLQRVKDYGAVASAHCTVATSSVLRGVPGFESLPATWFPKTLAEAFGQLPGVRTRVLTNADDDKSHGIKMVHPKGGAL